MATAAAPQPQPQPEPEADHRFDPTEEFPRPPAEDFWEKYSGRLEMPMSWTGAVLFHVLVGVAFFAAVTYLMNSGDRSGVPVKLVNVDGYDDSGEGSAGSGGEMEPLFVGDNDPFKQAFKDILPTENLPTAKDNPQKIDLEDPNGQKPITDPTKAAEAALDRQIRDRKKGMAAQRGDGPEAGKGSDGSKGKGPGGTGNDATWARGDSWRLFFRFENGQKYIDQLAGLEAVVLIPLSDDNKDCWYFGDLKNPSVRRKPTDDDLRRLASWRKFYNQKPAEVPQVCKVLGVTEPAKAFWVFFPPSIAEELARKELNYGGKMKEGIDETFFNVVFRDGKYQFVVFKQTMKR